MANNNNNNPRRDSSRPEDNPFIAFRRYADSQVSSLLNTVFTLPAQIANYNNAHHAREQCLFGKADPQKCEELQALDAHTEKLRHEGTESYRAGDVQAVLRKSEQLMMLEQQAGELRRAILRDDEDSNHNVEQQKQLVEKVGNKKGQQWSDSWDWPEPTREEDSDDNEFERWLESRARRAGSEIERMFTRLEEDASKVFGEEIEELRRHWAARYDDTNRHEDAQPRVWSRSWSWQWPPPADAPKSDETKILEDPYSPSALEADERTKHMGSLWRNAFEDLMRTTQEHPLLSDAQNTDFDQMGLYALRDYQKELLQLEQQNRERLLMARQESAQKQTPFPQQAHDTSDEPSYEYAHDHEDQHDDPPTPKPQQTEFSRGQLSPSEARQNTETELDAYERLLTPSSSPSTLGLEGNSTILSTLTTTERTTAPDGTVTTKLILKKRFTDGSEQSSETVHTQRGDDVHYTGDPWKVMQNAHSPDSISQKGQKKGGWFWSN
ncbi:hypothetical protein BU25DRAFT_411535 [Macroventuria anomochaeta]|uniref:Uncharacterized protein n=1 Tax=Macroventuria anomochaeta TaxID=301207 RepID=A0ACB6S095_9PLEO|nr:uncharacterized protein BU25DRAFT_411535 [Macroventuria anomochaeta]KAF2626557.1 hypothetical protein BU25DRAFT_411535 [Macroventuria anomochaeta]